MALSGGHRTYKTHTKLGRIMFDKGVRSIQVTYNAGIHPRLMTDYLAGRKKPSPRSMKMLCEYLHVQAADLIEDRYPWTEQDAAAKNAARTGGVNHQKVSA